MDKELLKRLYDKAVDNCHSSDAWTFEDAFAKEIAKHCASICMQEHWAIISGSLGSEAVADEFYRGVRSGRKMMAANLASIIKNEFGVE